MDGINTATTGVANFQTAPAADTSAKAKTSKETTDTKKSDAAEKSTYGKDSAAVYEKSDAKAAKTGATQKNDRSAIVAQMKADMEQQKSQLLDIVRKTIGGQGKAIGMAADEDSMWKFLASGDFTVDAATKAQAQADIADDGYWGVDKTSDRILDFAKALAGNDPEKADKMLDAFKKGFEEATKTWGKELPDISKRTYDAVVEKFDAWKNGTTTQNTDTE